MASKFTNIVLTLSKRSAAYRGRTSASDWNSTLDELIRDLGSIIFQWNASLLPLTATLPNANGNDNVDAFSNGLDGKTIYADSDASSTNETVYYSPSQSRPKTIKEKIADLYTKIAEEADGLNKTIQDNVGGLTLTQQALLNTIDLRSSASSANLIQLSEDLYDVNLLNGSGSGILNYSIKDMLIALLSLHGGSWNSNNPVSHSFPGTSIASGGILQSYIDSTISQSDSFAGTPSNTSEDLNQIRTYIKALKGTPTWESPDINNLNGLLGNIRDFAGMSSLSSPSHSYANSHYIIPTEDLEDNITILDASLWDHSQYNNPHQVSASQVDNVGGSGQLVAQINSGVNTYINKERLDSSLGFTEQITFSGLMLSGYFDYLHGYGKYPICQVISLETYFVTDLSEIRIGFPNLDTVRLENVGYGTELSSGILTMVF